MDTKKERKLEHILKDLQLYHPQQSIANLTEEYWLLRVKNYSHYAAIGKLYKNYYPNSVENEETNKITS